MKRHLTILTLALLGLGICMPVRGAKLPVKADVLGASEAFRWNFDEAMEEARRSGKDLFVDFSGSDWCIWCIRLAEEVLHEKAFLDEARKHFVLVELDYPRKAQDPAVKMQNARLKEKYAIAGYPTVYLMDAEGRPYARTGYRRGGPAPYLEHLKELRAFKGARDAALSRAKALEGAERARALDEALAPMEKAGVLSFYAPEMKEIMTLAAGKEAALVTKYGQLVDRMEIEAAEGKGDFDEALKRIEAFRKKHAPAGEELQQLLVKVGMIHYRRQDVAGAIAQFEKAREANSGSPLAQQISIWIGKLRAMSEKSR